MTFSLLDNQRVSVAVAPVDAAGKPSAATLSAVTFVSSDAAIAKIEPDPSNPNGAVLTAVAEGSSTISATATATESDNSTHTISGSVTVTVTAAAAGLAFTFGSPSPNH